MEHMESEIIRQAIVSEMEGVQFYSMAAAKATQSEAAEAFLELAQEEQKHIEWLKNLYNRLLHGEDSFDLSLLDEVPVHSIFNTSHLDRENAEIALSVFGIGIQIERTAVEYYNNASGNTRYKSASELYKQLAKWEESHLEQFSRQYEELKGKWWADQNFEPF